MVLSPTSAAMSVLLLFGRPLAALAVAAGATERLSRKLGRTAPFSDLIDHEMAPGNAVDDGEALRANIVANAAAYLHPTSTVPMGAASDPTAVVDAWGKVRGVEALRVVDASILPDIPSVPTNVTTIMVAERKPSCAL